MIIIFILLYTFKYRHYTRIIYFSLYKSIHLLESYIRLQKEAKSISQYQMLKHQQNASQAHYYSSEYSDKSSQYGDNHTNFPIQGSDSDDDQYIKKYHQMLMEVYNEDYTSQYSQSGLDNLLIPNNYDDSIMDKNTESVKSLQISNSIKSFQSYDSNKSLVTMKTNPSQFTNASKQSTKQKRKYMKQQARKIKNQLKQEEIKMKREKREFRDLDIDLDSKKRSKAGQGKHRRRRLTKKILELLAKKFDEYYAFESNRDYKGPRMTLKDIGQLFDMGNSTIHKLYVEWMQDPSFYERINRQNMKKKLPQRKVTLQRLQHVARLIKQNPFLTQNQLTVQLNKIQDLKFYKNGQRIQITRTTVARLLKVGKFKKKRVKCVPKQRNTTKSLEKRYNYCTKYQDIWMRNAKIYFLDQSGFNLYMTRDKAWARPNQEITVNCPIAKGKRFSLIALIAQDGLTHWRIIQGTYRKYQYLDFIKQFFARLCQQMQQLTQQERQQQQNKRQKWLILDNCAIHDKQQTINLGKQCNMHILYLPPYSPQLNPIENWFHEVKAKIRKINYSGQKQLLQIMQRTLLQYESHDFANYFKGVLKHVQKGINKQKF